MPSEQPPWFVLDRSEALVGLLLTSRKNLAILKQEKREDGTDFVLAIEEGEVLTTRLFVVRVRGTMSLDKSEWRKDVTELFSPKQGALHLPVCVVVVNVRDKQAQYAWVAEPVLGEKGATLRFLPPDEFHDLDAPALDDIIGRVKAWYDALPRQSVPAAG